MGTLTDISTRVTVLSLTPTAEKVLVRVDHQGASHQLTLVGDFQGGIQSIIAALPEGTPIETRLGEHTDQLAQSPRFVTIYGRILTALQSTRLTRLVLRTRSSGVYLLTPLLRQFGRRALVSIPIETPNLKLASTLISSSGCSFGERMVLASKLTARGIATEFELTPIFKGFAEASTFSSFIASSPIPVRLSSCQHIDSELRLLNRELENNQLALRMISRSVRLRERFCQLLGSEVEWDHELADKNNSLEKMA